MITEDEMKEHIADLYAAVASLQELHRILDYAYKSAFKTDALFRYSVSGTTITLFETARSSQETQSYLTPS